MPSKAQLLDAVDRVGWTFIQALTATALTAVEAGAAGHFDWKSAVLLAGQAALIAGGKVLGVNLRAKAARDTSVASSASPGNTLIQEVVEQPEEDNQPVQPSASEPSQGS